MVALVIGKAKEPVELVASRLNRHGLIAGATGTGKTVTLKVLAEALSDEGIPVFLADVKGDLSNLSQVGELNENIQTRVSNLQIDDYEPAAYPVHLWDVLGQDGIPIRTSVSEMGPILLAQLLGLNETQEGVLNIAFKLADERQLQLIDLKDLRAMLNEVGDNAESLRAIYGNVSKQTIGAILRGLLVLEEQGGDVFFGEPVFDIHDLIQKSSDGRGIINILSATKLFLTPKLYATFLLWFLSELYETLPEVGDLDKPKLVFFFDEAHVLFQNISTVVQEKIELIVRLIRSKGVGVFFITQNPLDIPETIASQLGTRIQHALRAFTPKEQKNVKAIAETFRQEDGTDLVDVILNLKVGEAVVSYQQADGSPSFAEIVTVYPPKSSLIALPELTQQQLINQSIFYGKYMESVDNFSAYEQLQQEKEAREHQQQQLEEQVQAEKQAEAQAKQLEKQAKQSAPKARQTESPMDKFTKNIMSSVGREVGKAISRGIMGLWKK